MSRAELVAAACVVALASGCKQTELSDQPRDETFDRSRFFQDGRTARTPASGTVARGQLRDDPHLDQGLQDGQWATGLPFELSRADLERGRARYDAFCSPCHGFVGEGDGMIVRRGFPLPPTLHSGRLRDAAPGYMFQVISRGAAAMPAYATQIRPRDRWRIVGYMRALQRSQFASREDVPPEQWARLLQADDEDGDELD